MDKCGREDCYQEVCMASRYEFPVTNDLVIASLYMTLARIDQHMQSIYDDPMDCGCLEDFAEDADRKRRKVLGDIARRAKIVGDTAATLFVANAFEAWMP